MPSELKVNKLSPYTGSTLTLGDSGDTIAITSGASLTGFTSTGIDDNATNTAVTIDSSQNVGIGTTSPSVTFDAEANGATVAHFNRTTDDGNILELQKDGTTVGSIGAGGGEIFIGNGDMGIRFDDISDAIKPYNPSSLAIKDDAINIGVSTQRFKDLYLSGNIYLGGTTSANALDDYEEGTATLTMGGGTTNPSTTQSTNGYYVKVGVFVTVWFRFASKDNTGASGVVEVDGLPFTVTSLIDGYGIAWGGRDSAGGTGHKVWGALNGTTSAKMIDGSGNNVNWSTTGSGTFQGGVIVYIT